MLHFMQKMNAAFGGVSVGFGLVVVKVSSFHFLPWVLKARVPS